MNKILSLVFVGFIFFTSCMQNNEEQINTASSKHYPNINFDYLEGIGKKRDSVLHRIKVEIQLDSIGNAIWVLDDKIIPRAHLLPKLEEIQLRLPESKRHQLLIDLGIDKNTTTREFNALRDSLRIGRHLRGNYLNAAHQRSSTRFPVSPNPRLSKLFAYPPLPPPGVEDIVCPCCKTDGQYITSTFDTHSKPFDSLQDCIKGSTFNEFSTFLYLEKDKFYWEGKALDLSTIEERIHDKYTNCSKPIQFVTILKIDSSSKFESYLNMYSISKKMYVDQWNDKSLEKYNKLYKELSLEEKKTIRARYPLIISEYFD